MSLPEILLIAVGLSMDAFAVTLAATISGQAVGTRAALRLAFHFGLFQFAMPVIGWFAGITVAASIGWIDHWVAFALLAFVGIRMIRSSRMENEEATRGDPSRGFTLVLLALATSIDALAVGLSLALVGVEVWHPSAIIGLVTFVLCLIAAHIGHWVGPRFGRRLERLGGLILIGIGLRILVSHLLGGGSVV